MQPVIRLVDDETDLVEVLRDALELSMPAYRALAATSSEGALSALELLRPEELALVCVDQRLGPVSGVDVLRVVRRRWPDVPAMVFTGQVTPDLLDGSRALGAHVVTKPLRLSEWLTEVQRLLDTRRG
jgi:DNA-binding response OmpR family regulator